MARKRGGLAGLWDRSKKVIKPLATGIAGIVGTPALGAAVGAALNGFDREGKSGIGFDVGKGAMGAATGYGMGKVGGALKSGVLSRLGGGAAQQAMPSLPGMDPSRMIGITGGKGIARAAGQSFDDIAGGFMPTVQKAAGGIGSVLRDGKTMAALGQTALGGLNAYQQNQQMQMEREQMAERRRLEDEERQRRAALDPVRSQVLAALFGRLGLNQQGGGMA